MTDPLNCDRSPTEDADSPAPSDMRGDTARQAGTSLAQLTAAFAEMLGDQPSGEYQTTNDASAAKPADASTTSHALESSGPSSDDACQISPKSILEALLFVGNPDASPVTTQRLAGLMRGVSASEIDQLVRQLNQQYAANGCPYYIRSEGAGYRLALTDQFHGLRDKFFRRVRYARLSQAAIEVLALVAYNGPLAGDQVSRLRGKPSGQILAQLVRRRLLAVERSAQKPRTARYRTTPRFLELFGLESLEDLPRSYDLDKR